MPQLTLIDKIANLPSPDPQHRGTHDNRHVAQAVRALRRMSQPWTVECIHGAIRSHNHDLFRWLMNEGAPRDQHTAWVVVESRNRAALAHTILDTDHFREVALADDTQFLGHMFAARRAWEDEVSESFTCPDPVSVPVWPFRSMLRDEHDGGYSGFWWLLRHRLVARWALTPSTRRLIVARYGPRARRYL